MQRFQALAVFEAEIEKYNINAVGLEPLDAAGNPVGLLKMIVGASYILEKLLY